MMEATLMQQGANAGVLSAAFDLPASSSNTNGNANSDVAGVDQLLQDSVATATIPIEERISLSEEDGGTSSSTSSPSLSPSPPSSYQTESYSMEYSHVQQLKPSATSVMSNSHVLLSPIAGDVPMIHQVTSPSLPQFEFASTEQTTDTICRDPQSPNPPSAAKLHSVMKRVTEGMTNTTTITFSEPLSQSNSLSPTTVSSISPTHSFTQQQGIVFDHRSELSGIPSSILFQPSLTTLTTTALPPDDEEMEEGKLHICLWDNCGHEFATLSSLVAHLDRGHTISLSKYVCLWKDCSRNQKPFDARYKLITHLRCHTGEKPYRCEVPTCNRSFSRLENLKLHVRTHTGEKPYECHYDGCTKKFNNTSDRAKHMKTHITRKPYACKYPGCGKSYTDPSSMRKHIKYTHKLKEKREGEQQNQGTLMKVNGDVTQRKATNNPSLLSCTSPSSSHMANAVFIGKHQTAVPAVTLSQVGSPMPIDSRLLHPIHSPPAMSPPTTTGHMINGAAPIVAIANQPQAQLIPVPLVHLPARGQSSPTQPLNIVQQNGQSVLIPSASAVSTQQPVIMVLANSGATNGGQILPQTPSPVPTPTVNATTTDSGAIGSPVHATSTTIATPISISNKVETVKVSNQQVDTEDKSSSNLQNSQLSPSSVNAQLSPNQQQTVEAQLRLQIAHLQQQLYQSQAQTQILAAMQQQQQVQKQNGGGKTDEQQTYVQLQVSSPNIALPPSLAANSKGASPTKVAMVTTATQSTLPFTPVVSPQLAAPSSHPSSTQHPQQRNTNKPAPILLANHSLMNSGQAVSIHPFMFPHGAHVIPIVQSQDIPGQYLCMAPNP